MIKRALLNFMRVTGAFTTFRLANRSKVLVLMYHRFGTHDDSEKISVHAFRAQLAYLTTHYQVVTLSNIADLLARGETLPPRLAVITIDDGYRDVYEVAFPILRQFKAPATLFVVTDFIEEKAWLWTDKLKFMMPRTSARRVEVILNDTITRFELTDSTSRKRAVARINSLLKTQPDKVKEQAILQIASSLGVDLPAEAAEDFQPLTWDEVRELDTSGIEIGSHTVTHPILTQIDNQQLRYELYESKLHLEARLQRDVNLFCYPNGNHNEQILSEVKRAGYTCAVTTNYGLNGNSMELLRLRRISAESDLSHFMQSTSGFEEAKSKFRSVGVPFISNRAAEGLQNY